MARRLRAKPGFSLDVKGLRSVGYFVKTQTMFSNMNSCKNTRWRKPYVYLLGAALLYLIFRRLARGAEATGRRSLGSHLLEKIFDVVNRVVPWHKLPTWLAAVNLISFRDVLREKNLHDTSPPTKRALPNTTCDPRSVYARRSDGTCNDLEHPEMGAAGERFGRNVPREYTFPEKEPALLSPSPRVISQRLLARESFRPAHSLNLLAAAWIQFQTHDWFAHHRATKLGENDFQIPLDPNDNWPSGAPMRIPRTPPDPTRQPESPGRLRLISTRNPIGGMALRYTVTTRRQLRRSETKAN
jgi:hypothetical protein